MRPSFDSVAAMIRDLSIEEQEALVDSNNRSGLKKFLQSCPKVLLHVIKTKFVVPAHFTQGRNCFQVHTSGGKGVDIRATPEVMGMFPDKTYSQGNVLSSVTMASTQVVRQYVKHGEIIDRALGKMAAETNLRVLLSLAAEQDCSDRSNEFLLTNGNVNVFYVRGRDNMLHVVHVAQSGGSWLITTNLTDYREYECVPNARVFFVYS